MHFFKKDQIDYQQSPTPAKNNNFAHWAIVLGLVVLYVVTFKPLVSMVGPVASALIALPVAIAGWYFGLGAALVASVIAILINTFLLVFFNQYTWSSVVTGWPGDLMVIVIGYIAGRFQKGFSDLDKALKELRSRERYLSLINITTKDILSPKIPEDRYYFLVSHLANLFVADYAHFIRWDSSQGQAVLLASTLSSDEPVSQLTLDSKEAELTNAALQSGQALALVDVPSSNFIVNPAVFTKFTPPIQSALCIPLIARENKFGTIIIVYNTKKQFTSKEIEYAELAGSQIALSLWTVDQELKIQKRLKEANTLAKIERALSETERVGIENVLQLIVDSAKELIPGAQHAVLHLLDNENKILIPRAVAGFSAEVKTKLNMRPGEGVAGQVIASGSTTMIDDAHSDPSFSNQVPPENFRSLIVAPVQSNERNIGTISIQSEMPYAFTADDCQLLGALGIQAAIAIDNANLLETTQHDLKEINALYQVSKGLAASLNPDQLMKDVADLLQHNFGYYHVQIYAVSPNSHDLIAQHGSGKIGDQLRWDGYRLQQGMGIVGHVAETGEPFVTNDVEEVVFFVRNDLLPDTHSELTVPIKIEKQVVGVLDIQQVPPGHLTFRDLQLMSAVADQLAVSLQKANLYTDLEASLNQEKAVRTQLIQSERLAVVGRLLASVSHELNNPLQAIQNALYLLKEGEKLSSQGHQDLEIVLSETERMNGMIERLRATYRPTRTEDFQNIQLNKVIEDVQVLTATHMRHNEIVFQFSPDPDLPEIPAIPDQIRQVVLNLFMNAVEAMSTGGHLNINTSQFPDQGKILITVTDTGPGIDPKILPHIFEPFVTGKETGTGLGLTITNDIVHKHNGEIQAENNPEGGATFKVWLPTERKFEHEPERSYFNHR